MFLKTFEFEQLCLLSLLEWEFTGVLGAVKDTGEEMLFWLAVFLSHVFRSIKKSQMNLIYSQIICLVNSVQWQVEPKSLTFSLLKSPTVVLKLFINCQTTFELLSCPLLRI